MQWNISFYFLLSSAVPFPPQLIFHGQGPKFQISSLLSSFHMVNSLSDTDIRNSTSSEQPDILFLLRWVLSYADFTNLAGTQIRTFSVSFIFRHIRCRLESFSFCSVSLNLLYISIPIVLIYLGFCNRRSLTRFPNSTSIPLVLLCIITTGCLGCWAPKTQNQIQGCHCLNPTEIY